MIAEAAPQHLIDQFAPDGSNSLEKAVLQLCKDDSLGELENLEISQKVTHKLTTWDLKARGGLTAQISDVKMATVTNKYDDTGLKHSGARIKSLAKKNVTILIRNLL